MSGVSMTPVHASSHFLPQWDEGHKLNESSDVSGALGESGLPICQLESISFIGKSPAVTLVCHSDHFRGSQIHQVKWSWVTFELTDIVFVPSLRHSDIKLHVLLQKD